MLSATRILFSGGRTLDSIVGASNVSSAAALGMGVAPDAVSLSVDPRTTAEEMACIRSILGAAPFIMVTSAMHMPRAMRLAERAGLYPVPSPTDYRGFASGGWLDLLPRAGAPLLASAVTHEIAGLARPRIDQPIWQQCGRERRLQNLLCTGTEPGSGVDERVRNSPRCLWVCGISACVAGARRGPPQPSRPERPWADARSGRRLRDGADPGLPYRMSVRRAISL